MPFKLRPTEYPASNEYLAVEAPDISDAFRPEMRSAVDAPMFTQLSVSESLVSEQPDPQRRKKRIQKKDAARQRRAKDTQQGQRLTFESGRRTILKSAESGGNGKKADAIANDETELLNESVSDSPRRSHDIMMRKHPLLRMEHTPDTTTGDQTQPVSQKQARQQTRATSPLRTERTPDTSTGDQTQLPSKKRVSQQKRYRSERYTPKDAPTDSRLQFEEEQEETPLSPSQDGQAEAISANIRRGSDVPMRKTLADQRGNSNQRTVRENSMRPSADQRRNEDSFTRRKAYGKALTRQFISGAEKENATLPIPVNTALDF